MKDETITKDEGYVLLIAGIALGILIGVIGTLIAVTEII